MQLTTFLVGAWPTKS